ncbi:replication initiation negative regulator SeqA [Thalassotalea psychrophila]|uniref:Negative modulator of initiation of replication n=1 Tax=Thalassotalea psychrophila TaxID=3065647 RepID=A0ABY9TQI7_9GAMM|nr:replication initiation negative regulator SeqA [Colwelliaceae bacterium SQ149]
MKTIDIDDELYQYIASNTKFIGESASDILRRLLSFDELVDNNNTASPEEIKPVVKAKSKKAKVTADVVDLVDLNAKKAIKPEPVLTSLVEGEQNIFDVINKEELATQKGAVGRFLLILSNMHRVHSQQFDSVLDIQGRDRLYFANAELDLLEAGSSTKPKQIPNSEFWVITNSNTTRKKRMLTEVANVLGYSTSDAEKIRDFL